MITGWRDTYRAERQAAIERYRARPRVAPLLRDLSRAADRLLQTIWAHHDLPPRAALVAVGGYGRGELFPQSDIDLLILTDDALPDTELSRFEPLIGLFWDVGLPVGHSVRRLSECLAEAASDLSILTTLIEARPLAGAADLFATLRQRLNASLDASEFLAAKRLEQEDRHGRFSIRGLRLEPNLKDGPGGLRDLHTVGWVARAAGLENGLGGLVSAGLLTGNEARRIKAAQNVIAQVRIRLHLLANRAEERLVFEYQERIAAEMGIAASKTRRASEILMQRVFRASREIGLACEFLLGNLQTLIAGEKAAQSHLLDSAEEKTLEREPALIFESFLNLQRNPNLTGFTPRALRALWRAGPLITPVFRRDPAHQAQFLTILKEARVALSLRLMHRLGLLGRYLPAFARITGQMQHDLYHVHPVDEHTLMLVRNLDRFALTEFAHEFPLAHRIMESFARPDLLYLAALFHDIAKGRGGDHAALGAIEMHRFCRSHRLPGADTGLLTWLVENHLLFSSTAQKQDLTDPAVIAAFATRCATLERLNALYLLSVADIRATNPAIWNAWKDNLFKTLYRDARAHLEGGGPPLDSVETRREQARILLRRYNWPDTAEEPLWSRLDDMWFLRLDADEIAWQTHAILPRLKRQTTIVRARLAPIGEGAEVVVYTPDSPGLFARICGFFAAMGYSVLEARIHTSRDGHALDSFLIMDVINRQIAYRDILGYIEFELAKLLAEARDIPPTAGRIARQLKAFPITPQIALNRNEGRGEGSHEYTLTFAAGDRPGLLHDIAKTLARHGVNVQTARIHTLGGRAEDVFVIAGKDLERAELRLALERELLALLTVKPV